MHEIVPAAGATDDAKAASTTVTVPASHRARLREGRETRALRSLATLFFVGALAFAGLAWGRGDIFFLRLGTEALIYGALALSADLLLGYTGLLSLGQALYFGLGAYVSALVLKEVAPSFWLALATSLAAGLFAGALGGVIAVRARGVYFALITYGMAQVVAKIVYNTRELGASDGIIGIPIITVPLGITTVQADDPLGFFLVVLTLVAIMYALLAYVTNTPFGRVLSAVRVNEKRLPFLGFPPGRFKFAAVVLASAVAAVAGSLYPMLRGFVSPELMYFEVSTNAIIAVITGGAGTLIGALYGSIALVFGKSVIGTFTEHHLMVVGALFMASVIFLPRGLIGMVKARMTRPGTA
jgi:branched-chain amino acid transport system permease protein